MNWNSWNLLSRCLQALSYQTFRDFEVIIADNNSKSEGFEPFVFNIPKISLVKFKINYGFAEANNRLIKMVKHAEWVLLLNPDAFPEPDWLEQLVAASILYPEYACFASRLIKYNNDLLLDGEGDSYHISGLAWRKGYGTPVASSTCKSPKEVFSACAAAAMYKNESLIKVGGFDSTFFCYFEDVDLGFRLRLAGYRCLYVPMATVKHVGSAITGGRNSDFAVYYGHRNAVWTYFKNMPGILLWSSLPFHIIQNLISVAWYISKGQDSIIFKSKFDAFKNLGRVWKLRKKIQRNSQVSALDILRTIDIGLIPRIYEKFRNRN
ncbi:MAG: glycosyltransferase family 2 protein [Desulfatitalea sp.]|nr:glycosyltransferase family 2 protein [Desulfatitalea sp.]